LVRVRSSLCEALNHLETARASILAWGNRLDAERCLEGFYNLLRCIARGSRKKGKMNRRNRRFLLMAGARLLLYRIWLYRDLGDTQRVISLYKELERFTKSPFGLGKSAADEYENDWRAESFWIKEQCQLERAIVCISLRNYDEAASRLEEIVARAGLVMSTILGANRDKDVEKYISEWADCQGRGKQERYRYERRRLLVFALRRLMENHLLQHEVQSFLDCANWGESIKKWSIWPRHSVFILPPGCFPGLSPKMSIARFALNAADCTRY
jgi:hypothetical protein